MSGINDVKYTVQEMGNKSFDDQLKVNMVEIIGADGVLQNFGGTNIPTYDTTSVDMSDPFNIVITYKLSGVTVATETATKTGTTWNIVKT